MATAAAAVSPPIASTGRSSLASTTYRCIDFSIKISPWNTSKPHLRVTNSIGLRASEKTQTMSFLHLRSVREGNVLYFVKYHGLGNDFIMVDNRDSMEPKITPKQALKLCDRNFGVGADGAIFAMPGINGTDYTMRIFNSDGSEPEMCGNGVRCFARFIAELENINGKQSFTVHTGAGLIVTEIQEDGKVKVDMGEPILNASEVPTKLPPNKDQAAVKAKLDVDGTIWNVTCVSMGNPHCITFGADSGKDLQVDELNLVEIGPRFEHHEMFPARTNTEFVQVISPRHLKMRVQRGADVHRRFTRRTVGYRVERRR